MSRDRSPSPGLAMRLEALIARLMLCLLGALRPDTASNLGGGIARLVGPRLRVSRVAHRNLQRAMPELDLQARRRIVRDAWENLGRTVAEMPHLASLRKDTRSGPGWTVEGEEVLREQARRGGPAIFVSAHIGNWEMLTAALATYSLPFASVYRAASNPLVDRILRDLRDRTAGGSLPLFSKGSSGARQALAHLGRGGCLGLLVDQKMNDGVEARFFGLPAMTAPAASVMALRRGIPVIPGYVVRIGPARLHVVCEPPLDLPSTGDRTMDQLILTQRINDRIEAWIRERPGSWLWMHRRWPKAPDPRSLTLRQIVDTIP